MRPTYRIACVRRCVCRGGSTPECGRFEPKNRAGGRASEGVVSGDGRELRMEVAKVWDARVMVKYGGLLRDGSCGRNVFLERGGEYDLSGG